MQKETIDVNIGEAIKEGLKRHRISQAELANIMDVSQPLVSTWIKNHRIPTGKDLIRLALILDIVPKLFPGYAKVWENSGSCEHSKILEEMEKLWQKDCFLEERIKSLEKALQRK